MRNRIAWMLFMAFAYWLMWSKGGYDSTIEAMMVVLAGGVVGLSFSYASERPENTTAARLKIAYWPLALALFVTYPVVGIWWDNRDCGMGWMWKPFSVATGIGLLFGIAHYLTASRKLHHARVGRRMMAP